MTGPLTDTGTQISAFVTPDGLYEFNVMAFGMENAPGTFTRLMNIVTRGLEGCETYFDDVIIHSDTWDNHVERVNALFDRLEQANRTVSLTKSEMRKAHVTYLGHIVTQGQVLSKDDKDQAMMDFEGPGNRTELQEFLGMVGF